MRRRVSGVFATGVAAMLLAAGVVAAQAAGGNGSESGSDSTATGDLLATSRPRSSSTPVAARAARPRLAGVVAVGAASHEDFADLYGYYRATHPFAGEAWADSEGHRLAVISAESEARRRGFDIPSDDELAHYATVWRRTGSRLL